MESFLRVSYEGHVLWYNGMSLNCFNVVRYGSRSFGSPPFIDHYQLKHKSSDQGQTNQLIELSYI